MAVVVLLRGINVGGHRRFRPSLFASELRHLDIVNIGAAGTFVVRAPVGRAALQRECARRLPFDAGITICDARQFVGLLSHDAFARYGRPGITRFVSVLAAAPRARPALPITMPERGRWLLKVLARDGRFVLGAYRRDMKVIGYLASLDRAFGVPVITRNWNTITAVARVLDAR